MVNNIIIGNGTISFELKKKITGIDSVEVVSYRDFFNKKNLDIPNLNHVRKIYFVGINKSNLLKNVFDTLKIIKFLNSKNWNGKFLFLSSQQSLNQIFKKNFWLITKGYYGFIKSIQTFLIKNFSFFDFCIIYLPYVIGEDNSWDKYFTNISKSEIVYLPEAGANKIAICDLSKLTDFLLLDELKHNFYFLYSEIHTIKELLVQYSFDIKNIYQSNLSIKERMMWNAKNSYLMILMRILKDIFSLTKIKVYDNQNVCEKKTFYPSIEEKVNFSSSIMLERIENINFKKI